MDQVQPEQTMAAARGQRSMLVDVVRGFAIALVALGHTDQGEENRHWWGTSPVGLHLDQFIYSFHMPAFFFVSGVFLVSSVAKRGPASFVRTKLSQLIYPYVIWSVLQHVLTFPLHRFMQQSLRPPGSFLFGLLTGDTLWFFPAVFFCLVLGMLLRNVSRPLMFALALAVSWLPLPSQVAFVPATLVHFPFLVAGMWVGRNFERLERVSLPLAALGALLLGGLEFLLVTSRFHENTFLLVPEGLIGTAMLFLLARCFHRDALARTMAWVGEASLGVYLLSPYGQGIGRELLLKGLHTTEPYLQLLLPTALAVFVPALIYQYRVRLRLGWLFVWPF